MRQLENRILWGQFLPVFCVLILVLPAPAQGRDAEEEKIIRKCEVEFCRLIVNKDYSDNTIGCDVARSWGRAEILKGSRKVQDKIGSSLEWSWGDARCSANFEFASQPLIDALLADEDTLTVRPTKVTCQIGSGNMEDTLVLKVAPKLFLKHGKVVHGKLGLVSVEGPFIQRMTVKTAATIFEGSGYFKGKAIASINKFMARCPSKLTQ